MAAGYLNFLAIPSYLDISTFELFQGGQIITVLAAAW